MNFVTRIVVKQSTDHAVIKRHAKLAALAKTREPQIRLYVV